METTCTLELPLEAQPYLNVLEDDLKQIHGIQVLLVLPKDEHAPALISLGIGGNAEASTAAIRRITHILYSFLHGNASQSARQITLVTSNGNSVTLTALSSESIRQIIQEAYDNQDA